MAASFITDDINNKAQMFVLASSIFQCLFHCRAFGLKFGLFQIIIIEDWMWRPS